MNMINQYENNQTESNCPWGAPPVVSCQWALPLLGTGVGKMWSLFVLRQILHYSIQYTPGEGRQQGPWSCYNVVTTQHCLANCSPDIFISLLWLVTGTVDQLWGGGWVTMSWQTIIVLTRWRPLRWPELGRGHLVVSTPRLGLLWWGYKDHGKYVIKTLLLLWRIETFYSHSWVLFPFSIAQRSVQRTQSLIIRKYRSLGFQTLSAASQQHSNGKVLWFQQHKRRDAATDNAASLISIARVLWWESFYLRYHFLSQNQRDNTIWSRS